MRKMQRFEPRAPRSQILEKLLTLLMQARLRAGSSNTSNVQVHPSVLGSLHPVYSQFPERWTLFENRDQVGFFDNHVHHDQRLETENGQRRLGCVDPCLLGCK